jgi:hypothetical protein
MSHICERAFRFLTGGHPYPPSPFTGKVRKIEIIGPVLIGRIRRKHPPPIGIPPVHIPGMKDLPVVGPVYQVVGGKCMIPIEGAVVGGVILIMRCIDPNLTVIPDFC